MLHNISVLSEILISLKFSYSKNNIVVADVESEEEALEVVQDLTEDPWWKDEAPYRI